MAAGQGTRMKSNRPKVLHLLAGRSLLQHVLNAVAGLRADTTLVVIGHGADAVQAQLAAQPVKCVLQQPQLGTGHAVQQVVSHLPDGGTTLILNGDVPLIEPATAAALAAASGGDKLALLTIELADASGYGRIVRDPGQGAAVRAIVEHKDASAAQRAIREVYTGMLAAPTAWLKRAVMALGNDNAQQEYYLTDIVAMAVAEGVPVVATQAASETEVLGVNSAAQLADLERRFQWRQAEALMQAGVRLADPARTPITASVIWVKGWISAPASMRALRITQWAPIVTSSPSVTSPSKTQPTSMLTSWPQVSVPRRSKRAGSARRTPACISASAWRHWKRRSRSASCIALLTPSTSVSLAACVATTGTPSATAVATMSVR
jgi:UDP-N-acetylglucosamine diphosphorylase/glucosamine-1-phosphate N-acetyltransferase